MRNPKRTAASASALMIGVALVGFITIFVSSSKASIDNVIDKNFTGDLILDSRAGVLGGVDAEMAERLNALPQVAAATGLRVGAVEVDGDVTQIVGVDPATAFNVVDVKVLRGSPGALGPKQIAVFEDTAKAKGLDIGDVVPVRFKDTGLQQLTIAMVYGENRLAGDWFLGEAAYELNFANRLDWEVYVQKAADVSLSDTRKAVEAVAASYPGVEVMDREEFSAQMAEPFNQMLALVYALLGLAILIALLGIGNTLALSIMERTRELGLLRSVGMTRGQLRAMIRWESVIIAVQGTVLGLAIGMFLGWAMVRALSDKGIEVFRVPVGSLGLVVLLGAVAGMLAAVLPARRAARLNVLRAVTSD